MAEPEELIIDAARHATAFVSRLWHGTRPAEEAAITLVACRPRLELLLAAALGHDVPVRVAQPPAPSSGLFRLFDRTPGHLLEFVALPAHDGEKVFLPLELMLDTPTPFSAFRLLALQQARRGHRRMYHPHPQLPPEALTRDLFLISEAAATDHALAREFPGLMQDLVALRSSVSSQRQKTATLNAQERAVENLYRGMLDSHPAAFPPPFILAQTPGDSLLWATATAGQISGDFPAKLASDRYRGIARDLWLGKTIPLASARRQEPDEEPVPIPQDTPRSPPRTAQLMRRPDVREKEKDEDDTEPGMWMLQMDDPQQHVEDPAGMQRPADRDDHADAGDLADSLAELPEARLVSSSQPVREVLLGEDPLEKRASPAPARREGMSGIAYPEWDYRTARYLPDAAIVRLQTPPLGASEWAEATLARHGVLLREVQRRFEGLRPRRIRHDRQLDGDDIDIAAYVNAWAGRCAGLPLEDRLYQSVTAARRDIAIALLIDISGSTDGWVSRDQRIIDVEKEALLLVYRALKVLGDPFCIQGFSGESAHNVTIWPIKDFHEQDADLVQRRIAALEPQHHTRAGAAIRHTTALLAACPAQHRLFILLSDGKPNDIDHYEGRYGVEDTRQAVAEAVLQSIHPFCITVDRQAPQYLARLFGPGRYAVLQHPERLPAVLVDILRRLIRQ